MSRLLTKRDQTIAVVVEGSVRPRRLGHISAPLLWEEVVQGINPDDFHVRSYRKRLEKVGDLSTIMTKTKDFSLILHYFTWKIEIRQNSTQEIRPFAPKWGLRRCASWELKKKNKFERHSALFRALEASI